MRCTCHRGWYWGAVWPKFFRLIPCYSCNPAANLPIPDDIWERHP